MKLIASNTTKGAFKGIIGELKTKLADGGIHTIIVPDRFSMSVEKTILADLGLTASFNIEVVTFTRFAEKFLKGKINRCLTPEGSVMMLQRVIDQNFEKLVYYRKSIKKQGFTRDFYAALTSLRNSGITPQQLSANLEKLPVSIRGKLQDTAFLYQNYIEELDKNFTDSSTRLETFAAELEKTPTLLKHIYISGFYEFKAPELKIIEQFSRCAQSLTASLVVGFSNENARIYPHRTYEKLKTIGLKEGHFEVVRSNEKLDTPFDALSGWLYSYELPKKIFAQDKVALFKSPSTTAEVENIAINIKKLVIDGGLRFRDIGVAVSDIDEYAPICKTVFKRYGIPFFIDKQEMLVEQAKARFLLSALNVVSSRFSKDSVLEFVKNPLFELEAFEFENYVLAFGIDYSRFLSPFTLKYSGGNKEDIERKEENRKEAEKVRKYLCDLLSDFATADKYSALEYVEKLKSLEKKCDNEWQKYTAKLSAVSSFYDKCAEQVDKKIDAVFQEISEVFASLSFSTSDFFNMFKAMLSTLKIALLPLYIDSVFIGDTSDSRYSDVDTLFVAGAVEGKLPALSDGGQFLTDRDEQALEKQEIVIFPSTRDKNLSNMFEIVELLKMPKRKLYISYPDKGADGKSKRAASLITQISDLFFEDEAKTKEISCENTSDTEFNLIYANTNPNRAKEMAYRLCSRENCFSSVLDKVVAGALDTMFMQPFDACYTFLSDEQKAQLDALYEEVDYVGGEVFAKKNRATHTSVSQLEKYYQCPYQHFFKYGLELKVREESKLLNNEQGTIIHAVLEGFFKLTDIEKQDIKREVERIFDETMACDRFKTLAEHSSSKGIIRRLKKESVQFCTELYDIQQHSKFRPYLLEARFSSNWSQEILTQTKNDNRCEAILKPLALNVGGNEINLVGAIDRVDRWKNYIAVIDYKSYKSVELKPKDVYYGVKIQLYLYLLALSENFDLKPAGVFYLPVFASYLSNEKENRYQYTGQVLSDKNVIEALDDTFFDNSKKSVLPASLKKDGSINGNDAIDENTFTTLSETAKAVAEEGMSEIFAGYIAPRPLEKSCDYCDFREICGYKDENERKLASLSLSDLCSDVTEDSEID